MSCRHRWEDDVWYQTEDTQEIVATYRCVRCGRNRERCEDQDGSVKVIWWGGKYAQPTRTIMSGRYRHA